MRLVHNLSRAELSSWDVIYVTCSFHSANRTGPITGGSRLFCGLKTDMRGALDSPALVFCRLAWYEYVTHRKRREIV